MLYFTIRSISISISIYIPISDSAPYSTSHISTCCVVSI